MHVRTCGNHPPLAVQLFTAAVSWDASSSPLLWGPEVEARIEFVEPGNRAAALIETHLQRLRISKQPFAIGGMRLAYHAVTNDGQRYIRFFAPNHCPWVEIKNRWQFWVAAAWQHQTYLAAGYLHHPISHVVLNWINPLLLCLKVSNVPECHLSCESNESKD